MYNSHKNLTFPPDTLVKCPDGKERFVIASWISGSDGQEMVEVGTKNSLQWKSNEYFGIMQAKYFEAITKTSAEWCTLLYESSPSIFLDPDGWDRTNFQYSFYEEKITLDEFKRRSMLSTMSRLLTTGRLF